MSSVVQMPPPRRGLVAAIAENVRVECARKGWKQTGVRVLVDLPELGVAAGSEFLTLEAGQ